MTPEPADASPPPYEEGFLLALLILASGSLIWLFRPFLPGLFLGALLASATYPLYERLCRWLPHRPQHAALLMTLGVLAMVISPLSYLVMTAGLWAAWAVGQFKGWIGALGDANHLITLGHKVLAVLPLPREAQNRLLETLGQHRNALGEHGAQWLLSLFTSITDNGIALLASLALMALSLFFFYRDGPAILQRIKVLTPLPNEYDTLIFDRFSALATVLVLSTTGIALLQGTALALAAAFLDLPWFFLGVAVAVSSFVPVVGAFLVWGPTALYLALNGHPLAALFIAVWGAVVIGFTIDNILRPLLIQWLCRLLPNAGGDLAVLEHTLLTMLSTFGGVLAFGITGLFFGPMIAAMAISVFDLYELRHGHLLDRS
ncbi:MAG: AI-2E family transporter [Magnetococcales bacterium]|nr:AI-2E family transporter [Magnetococcales bacterium]